MQIQAVERGTIHQEKVQRGDAWEETVSEYPYIYFWNRMGRKGERCRVLIRVKAMNTCMVEFDDGFLAITSRNALRKPVAAPGREGEK